MEAPKCRLCGKKHYGNCVIDDDVDFSDAESSKSRIEKSREYCKSPEPVIEPSKDTLRKRAWREANRERQREYNREYMRRYRGG
jgi:hypothetical protein